MEIHVFFITIYYKIQAALLCFDANGKDSLCNRDKGLLLCYMTAKRHYINLLFL